jgi:hypothetical protein
MKPSGAHKLQLCRHTACCCDFTAADRFRLDATRLTSTAHANMYGRSRGPKLPCGRVAQISVKRRAHGGHEEAERAKRLHVLNTGFEPDEEGLFDDDDDEQPAAGDASLPEADGGAGGAAAEDDTAAALRELEGNDDNDE